MPGSILDQFRSKGKIATAIREARTQSLDKEEVLPSGALSYELRPYQSQGVRFLRERKRAILGDAPGLGKTFQAIEAATLPACITAPLSLIDQWVDFIQEQYPHHSVHVAAYGDIIKRDAVFKAFEADPNPQKWIVVNHDAFRTYYIPEVQTLIADEFHHFRNREAKRSSGLKKMAERTPNVFGLTATPVFKDVGDLYHLLHILDPKRWGSYWNFIQTYAVVDQHRFGTRIVRARSPKRLEEDTADTMLARTYGDVHMFLPDRIDKHVTFKMQGDDYTRYAKLRDYYRLELEEANAKGEMSQLYFNAGAVLHALRKLTVTKEKIEAVKQIIDDTPGEEPILIFCWYRDTAEVLAKACDGAMITGAIQASERRDLAHGMTGQRVRVATMESLSEGVDMSDARTVIFAEQSYVPGQMYQALSRVVRHRTGDADQDEPVIIYRVRYSNTVDQVVYTTERDRANGNAMSVLKEAIGF
jgi:superfamily II DNA or RNA helicase